MEFCALTNTLSFDSGQIKARLSANVFDPRLDREYTCAFKSKCRNLIDFSTVRTFLLLSYDAGQVATSQLGLQQMLESKKDTSGTFPNVWKRITALAILLPSMSAILKHKLYVLFQILFLN